MDVISTGLGIFLAVVLLVVVGLLIMISRLFNKVEQGKALIVSKINKVDVTFTGAIVLPIFHKSELMDISVKTIEIARTGREGLICRDNIRADIRITFFVRVNKTVEDVVKVAQAIGTARASDQETLQELFNAKFSEALKTVGKQLDFVDLYTQRDRFRDEIIQVIGTDLNGYSLEDAAIDYLEQTSLMSLDRNNILDAQGIRKITELTAIEHVRTNEFQRREEKEITRQNVDAREAILELERRQADAEIKQKREVETMRAREEAETAKVQAEERLKAHAANLRTDEQLGVQQENQAREIAVAAKNRERVLAIETERIEKDRLLEVIARERETELSRISKDKELEGEKRSIAEVIRERIVVEKTVAEQEESIKRLRVVEEAERTRQAVIIQAEAEAQESLVKDIKAAEASEAASKHKAREALVLAESRQQAAELDARAKIRLAEGVQAEMAAVGLAEVQVRERDAAAIEKVGRAEAAVEREKALAVAEGDQAKAHAVATAVREKLKAEAEGEQAMALAAAATVGEKLKAEAEGLTEKAAAMAALTDATRAHEEYRLRLEAEKEIRLAGVNVQLKIAEAQASVVSAGLSKANIDIVGGDTVFFDKLMSSITMGKAVDGFLEHSDVAQSLAGPYLNGSASIPADLGRVLGSIDTADVRNLSLSALLVKLIKDGGPDADRLRGLLSEAHAAATGTEVPVAALNSAGK
ncbi:flotillin family protein [Streptosporangium sp. NBC_01755]|uniref:flotillin family protein n=1 Tax=unclassified Streptosporangium TaxID=2632669 RepID=UPI002DDC5041|nr:MULTISPECIES: flotillin family protein [unclassified Streptosporangium]WSA23964.1 flotillin family protein [Streptosporangium sp. NBC_01810]WSC97960.1 flotillin family protein [Streptosporangium sp. NBC_01755]